MPGQYIACVLSAAIWITACGSAHAQDRVVSSDAADAVQASVAGEGNESPPLSVVADAIISHGDRLGTVQAVVLMDIAVGVPSIYKVAQRPATGSYLITFDSHRLRIVHSWNGTYSPDAPLGQVWTFEDGEWRLFDVSSKTLTRTNSFSINQGPIDPRMVFLQSTNDATLSEFPALYTAVATGVDSVDSSIRWWDVESKAFRPQSRLRIWCDSNKGGLPIKSQVGYPLDESQITTLVTELTYRAVEPRDALLIDTATLYTYNPRPITQPFCKEDWNLRSTMTMTDVKLLDDMEAQFAFRPENELAPIERVRDLSPTRRQQKSASPRDKPRCP